MAHDDHYHIHSHPALPPVPPFGPALAQPSNATVPIPVPENTSAGHATTLSFYSLERDLAQLRRDAADKKILSPNDREEIGTTNGPDPKTILSLVIGGNLSKGPLPPPKILVLGCHHAREWISVQVPYLIAEYLVDRYDPSPAVPPNESAEPGTKEGQAQRIKHLVGNREIWFVPMLNPEGHNHSVLTSRKWRPNRFMHTFDTGTTITAPRKGGGARTIRVPAGTTFTGVDINRNYATDSPLDTWGFETESGSTLLTSRDPRDSGNDRSFAGQVFCGLTPESERETQAIAELMRNQQFSAVISYHNFAEDILASDETFGDTFTHSVGEGMHTLIAQRGASYQFEKASFQDSTTGDAIDFFVQKVPGRRPGYTIELSPINPPKNPDHKFSGLPETEIRHVFEDNLAAALALINCAGFNSAPNLTTSTFRLGNPPWIATVIPNCWNRFLGWDPKL